MSQPPWWFVALGIFSAGVACGMMYTFFWALGG